MSHSGKIQPKDMNILVISQVSVMDQHWKLLHGCFSQGWQLGLSRPPSLRWTKRVWWVEEMLSLGLRLIKSVTEYRISDTHTFLALGRGTSVEEFGLVCLSLFFECQGLSHFASWNIVVPLLCALNSAYLAKTCTVCCSELSGPSMSKFVGEMMLNMGSLPIA